jgi:hypothetical protein
VSGSRYRGGLSDIDHVDVHRSLPPASLHGRRNLSADADLLPVEIAAHRADGRHIEAVLDVD